MTLSDLLSAHAQGNAPTQGPVRVDARSVRRAHDTAYLSARDETRRVLAVSGPGADAFSGEMSGEHKLCPLTPDNAAALRAVFPFTAPAAHRGQKTTMGLGDRLGLALPGQADALRGKGVFPVFCQQSIRELNLTGRTYEEVLTASTFGVFSEGWEDGFGADGDHLKTPEEIAYALRCGFTMITLDCSEHIDGNAAALSGAALEEAYKALPDSVRAHYESRYLDKPIEVESIRITPRGEEFSRLVLTYYKAIDYACDTYHHHIQTAPRPVDFELSIDETGTPTTPEAHFVVAAEMAARDALPVSLAPRFCGEFQKGIDYIGDIAQFEREFAAHAALARHFGYKLSIHSGSDKFLVFPLIGRGTKRRVHLKTAGTNWLEAVRVIAKKDPALYRALHQKALDALPDARRFYHIKGQEQNVAPLDKTPDALLPDYLHQDDARQILHITYGAMLRDPALHDRLYAALHTYEDDYRAGLAAHIGRHVGDLLGGI